MKNVDCEYMVNESHDCCNDEIISKWRKVTQWWPTCLEYANEHVTCNKKLSVWDELKKVNRNPKPKRPPAPPAPYPNMPKVKPPKKAGKSETVDGKTVTILEPGYYRFDG